MKRYAVFPILLLGGLCCGGCKESLPDNFDAPEGVYFDNRLADNTIVERTDRTFIYEDADEMEVAVRVQLVGRAADHDRPVDIRTSSADAVEGTDYTLPAEAVLPAGATQLDYVVTLHRTPELKERTKSLELKLYANECFVIPFTHQTQSGGDVTPVDGFTILFSDQFTAPPAGWETMFIGEFSQLKFELICEIVPMSRADFNEKGKITSSRWMYIQSRMIAYVREQESLRSEGRPYDERVFDETGEPLKFY